MRAIVLLSFFLSACGGLKGQVFLDQNHNNILDPNEPTISHLLYTVTKDGKAVATGMTDVSGSLELAIKDTGHYCVEIDEKSLTIQGGGGAQPSLVLPQSANAKLINSSKKPPSAGGKAASDGTLESDPVDDPAKSDTPAEDGSSDNKQDENKSDVMAGKPVEQKESSSESLKACSPTKSMSIEINVPVYKSFSEPVNNLPEPPILKKSPGEIITLSIVYPKACSMLPIALPYEIRPIYSEGSQYDPSVNMLPLALMTPALSLNVPPLKVNDEVLVKRSVNLKVAEDLSTDTTVTIQPKAQCPVGLIDLKKQQIKITTAPELVVELNHLSGEYSAGAPQTVEATVKNKGAMHYKDALLVVEFPSYSTSLKGSGCKNLGEKMSCTFDLAAYKEFAKKFTFKLKKNITDDKAFAIKAKVSVEMDGEKIEPEAEPIVFNIEGTDSSDESED